MKKGKIQVTFSFLELTHLLEALKRAAKEKKCPVKVKSLLNRLWLIAEAH